MINLKRMSRANIIIRDNFDFNIGIIEFIDKLYNPYTRCVRQCHNPDIIGFDHAITLYHNDLCLTYVK